MSFLSGFKKNLNRAGTTLMQRTGIVDKTVDREFDEEYERYKTLEQKTEKLTKEAKGYLDSLRAMTNAQTRIANTIHHFYDDSAPMGQCGIKYKETVEKLDEEAKKDMDATYRTTIIEPLSRYCAYFPDINEAIKRRNKKLLDYDAMRSKVRKLVDKPSEDAQRLPRAEQEANMAREVYENINSILISDLPKVIELRVPYIDPSFEALVKSQLQFCQTSYEHLEGLRQYFPPESEKLDGRAEDVLQQMRELSICGNNKLPIHTNCLSIMCILFWTINRNSKYRFIFVGNRDEYLHRPTSRAHFWDSPHAHVLAGTDLDPSATLNQDGSWLAITKNGQFAALTNYREMQVQGRLSRGCLVRDFVTRKQTPEQYFDILNPHKQEYSGFNLICGQLSDPPSIVYSTNREDQGVEKLQPRMIYGLSNSVLAKPWTKVDKGKEEFEAIVDGVEDKEELIEKLFSMMRESLPNLETSVTPQTWEDIKSTIFVPKLSVGNLTYATRTTTVILVDMNDQVTFAEREWFERVGEATYQERHKGNNEDIQRRFEFTLDP